MKREPMVDEKQTITIEDEQEQISNRKAKLQALIEAGSAYPNDFRRSNLSAQILADYDHLDKAQLEAESIEVAIAGRMLTRRVMGKASFIHIMDMSGKIQVYVQKNAVGEDAYETFKHWDIGDIVGIKGDLFKTKTGELTVKATNVTLITKSLRPLPDKFHGLANIEQRYRQRYLDLISNESSRQTFLIRSKAISSIRQFLIEENFLEVETPMMQVIPGGATARPFVTHHNTLGMDLYLRVAPELYLKRLLVGGFERVFEINRNFRNEGLSTRHNPEFTMLEYYAAYEDYEMAMDRLEAMMRRVIQDTLGSNSLSYQGEEYDISQPFTRLSMLDAIVQYNPSMNKIDLMDRDRAALIASKLDIAVHSSWGTGKIQLEIFEKTVEEQLKTPTFITAYPTEVSPLARKNAEDPFITDRFELFIGGRECANGFSELNDPIDQAARFAQQVAERESGDIEAMHYDADFITALEYGMPPAAGVGIGIDRLVMLLADVTTIRDVILFPHMRQLADKHS